MKTVPATHLKNRLGEVLREAALGPVAIERHGKVVAWLVPPRQEVSAVPAGVRVDRARRAGADETYGRAEEERLLTLCTSGDFRPSRWSRAGPPERMAGVAAMLGSMPGFDNVRMLALAERLHPGMSRPEVLGKWLAKSPVDPSRFFPMLEARMNEPAPSR